MKKAPNLFRVPYDLWPRRVDWPQTCIDGRWCPARPLGMFSLAHRLHLAWLVFVGKADAVMWRGPQ